MKALCTRSELQSFVKDKFYEVEDYTENDGSIRTFMLIDEDGKEWWYKWHERLVEFELLGG